MFPCREHARGSDEGHCPKCDRGVLDKASGDESPTGTLVQADQAALWTLMDDVQRAAPKAKVLSRDRVRFEIAGGNYRLVVASDFRRQIAFVKFMGTHAQYDKIDALTVSQF